MSRTVSEDALNAPALDPPDGITPNFENPSNRNGYVQASLGICLALSTIVMAIRAYTRFILLKMPHLGDYALIAAWALYMSFIGLFYAAVDNPGLFVHQWDLKMRDFINYSHLTVEITNIGLVFYALIKAAICLEWSHLFSPTRAHNFVYWSSAAILWANVIFSIISIVLFNITCVPYERKWNPLIQGTCNGISPVDLSLSVAGFNLATDIAILIIPQKTIWSLHLGIKQRLGIAAVFAIGLVACAAAALRLAFSLQRIGAKDFTYSTSSLLICNLAEGICEILVMCLPALPKFFGAIGTAGVSSPIKKWPVFKFFQRSKQSTQASSWSNSLQLEQVVSRHVRLHSNVPSDEESDISDNGRRSETRHFQTPELATNEDYSNAYAAKTKYGTRDVWS